MTMDKGVVGDAIADHSPQSPPPIEVKPYDPVGRLALGGDPHGWEAGSIRQEYRLTPYRPDTVVDAWRGGPFAVRAACVRGDAHRLYGVPRQDEVSVVWAEDRQLLAIAVADGVSSARLSHLGAGAACRYATEYLLRYWEDGQSVNWRELYEQAAWALVDADRRLTASPDADAADAERHLATTLCVAAVHAVDGEASIQAALAGDGGVTLLVDGALTPILGPTLVADDGMIRTEVVPLPRLPAELPCGKWALPHAATLLVGTDGIWAPLGDGTGTVAEFLIGALSGDLPDAVDFLRVVDFCRDTYDDDRTLVAVRLSPASDALGG